MQLRVSLSARVDRLCARGTSNSCVDFEAAAAQSPAVHLSSDPGDLLLNSLLPGDLVAVSSTGQLLVAGGLQVLCVVIKVSQ